MVFDYTAEPADELSIKVGEILEVWSVEVQQEGWWKVCNDCAYLCMYTYMCMNIWPNYIQNDNRMEVTTVSLYLVFVKFIFLLSIRLGKVIKWD